jgi:hypothetical protein
MTTENDTYKFLRIATKGFIPLMLDSKANLQDNHPFFSGKSDDDFYNAVVDGQVEFSFNSQDQEVGKMYIHPDIRMAGNKALKFFDPDIFVAPAKAESRIEEGVLKICLDLRIDIKAWVSPSHMNEFLGILSKNGLTHVRWSFLCQLNKGAQKINRDVGTQTFDAYQMERFKTRKLLLAAV